MLDKRVVFCYNPHPKANECVAQLVEHLTFNQVALGSNPSTLTILNKAPLTATFFINNFNGFDWDEVKKHTISSIIKRTGEWLILFLVYF